ncbi:hypothetical protein BOX15_Mlig017315g1 [Macrostomum lignano]|uniref:Tetraspanin n=1 Tax=Macrostomum lignano TaxID=282301 RepID=A0A267EV78_9PLAT|nr:hypothetical protein BOX15_Mlig017315g1 [Macrostomum lignano]
MSFSMYNGGNFCVNFTFILLGVGMFGYGMYAIDLFSHSHNGENAPNWIVSKISDGKSSVASSSASSIHFAVSGACSVLVGLFGFITTALKLRFVTLAYAVSLVGSLTLCLVSVILLFVNSVPAGNHLISAAQIKNTIESHYGNSSSNESISITQSINAFQVDHSCCGWSDDPDQNVFFNTPWTREANSAQLNTSATNLMSKIVYPLSCCTQLAEKSDRNLCVRARDGRLARKRGYIFAKNCMDILQLPQILKPLMVVQYIVLIVLQVLCIIMTVPMVIEHFVAPSSPTASPDSSTASQKADSDAQQRRVRFADQKQPRDQRNRNP